MAQADLARSSPASHDGGDTVYRYFTYLSPAHRAQHPSRGAAYGLEPYVMAGDVYSQPPYVGRGGWSWYTGAAGWMHRAAIESIFGLQQAAQDLCFTPCLPSSWHQAELTLRRDGRTMRFVLLRATPHQALEAAAKRDAQLLHPGQLLRWTSLPPHTCFVVPLPSEPERVSPASLCAAANP
jgi:cyclic beta-1,2-glucan synthetase